MPSGEIVEPEVGNSVTLVYDLESLTVEFLLSDETDCAIIITDNGCNVIALTQSNLKEVVKSAIEAINDNG